MLSYNFDGFEFLYSPDKEEFKKELSSLIMSDFDCTIETANKIIEFLVASDLLDEASERYEDELKEYFEDDARQEAGCDETFDRDDDWCHRQGIM